MAEYLYDGATFLDGDGNFVKVMQDIDCESPRKWDCNLGTFITWMRSYGSPDGDMTPEEIICDLGLWDEFEDTHVPSDEELEAYEEAYDEWDDKVSQLEDEIIEERSRVTHKWYEDVMVAKANGLPEPPFPTMPEGVFPEEPTNPYDKYDDPDDEDVQLNWLLKKAGKGEILLLPVSGYEHSGLTLSVGWPTQFVDWQWDAGFAGVIYTTRERAEKYIGEHATDEEILAGMKFEVEYYDTWGNGNCWGFTSYDKLGNEVDSCWGFIGETTECMEDDFNGGLHDCKFDKLYEYVEAHKDDPDVLVARYNEARDEFDDMSESLGQMLRNIVNVRNIPVRFENDRLVLEA